MTQIFNADDVAMMVFMIADLTEKNPELLDNYKTPVKAIAYKCLLSAPADEKGARDVKITVNLTSLKRGW